MELVDNILSEEELAESIKRIEDRADEVGVNKAAELDDDRRRKVRIYDEILHITTERRTLLIPQPTLGTYMLLSERRNFFDDDEHGLGRLLVTLTRQKEPGFIRALRMGGTIDDTEADDAMRGVYAEDKLDYFLGIERVKEWADEISEKKTVELLALRTGFDYELLAPLLKSSNFPVIPSTS